MEKDNGIIISFIGIDGSGKSTYSKHVNDYYKNIYKTKTIYLGTGSQNRNIAIIFIDIINLAINVLLLLIRKVILKNNPSILEKKISKYKFAVTQLLKIKNIEKTLKRTYYLKKEGYCL